MSVYRGPFRIGFLIIMIDDNLLSVYKLNNPTSHIEMFKMLYNYRAKLGTTTDVQLLICNKRLTHNALEKFQVVRTARPARTPTNIVICKPDSKIRRIIIYFGSVFGNTKCHE